MFKSKILLLLLPFFLMMGLNFAATEEKKMDLTRQYVSDSSITDNIKTELLSDKKIRNVSISVTTNNGEVILSGMVNNKLQKVRALDIAASTRGVKKVKDELVINAAVEQGKIKQQQIKQQRIRHYHYHNRYVNW